MATYPWPFPTGTHLTVVNQSSIVTAADVDAYVAAQQVQLNHDFFPAYGGGGATIDANPGGWPIYLIDTGGGKNDLGQHGGSKDGVPFARVFVDASIRYGGSWQFTASHEVCEMLADPHTDAADLGPDGCLWLQEVCDPVENSFYLINGVQMSDFVVPAWFTVGGTTPPFDFLSLLSGPFWILPGGYALEFCQKSVTLQRGSKHDRSHDIVHAVRRLLSFVAE